LEKIDLLETGACAVYLTYMPGPPLSSFVERFWLTEERDQPFTREIALPAGNTQLIIQLEGDPPRIVTRHGSHREQVFRESHIRGPGSDWYLLNAGRRMTRLGVQFKPGGAYPFFRPPIRELRNAHEPLEALWGAPARELRERLLELQTPAERFHLVERFLLAQAVRPLSYHPAVAYALRMLRPGIGVCSIAEIVEQVNFSHRQFIALFRESVGLAPKEYMCLRRFLLAARNAYDDNPVAWNELALQFGYSDQAHLCNEFRAFSGLTPGSYLKHRHPQFSTYIPLPAEGDIGLLMHRRGAPRGLAVS
jgi:AraC-like DNA-binding protein